MLFKKILYKLKLVRISVVFFVFYGIAWLVKNDRKYAHLWLISERGNDARDNAYQLFSYIREQKPDQNVCYVITDDSPDAAKVKKKGSTVRYGSPSHYLSMILAEALISTHLRGYTTEDYLFRRFERWGLLKGKKIFLRHGVAKDDMASLHYEKCRPDMFVCALEPEADFVKRCFHQPEEVVCLTGFCRFDRLPLPGDQREPGQMILLMPTWRHELYHYSKKEFEKSAYYQNWQGLLTSREFQDLLTQYDLKAIFYPHHQMQKFLDSFSSDSKRIVIASRHEYDVQNLLIESDVLITDFSSVFFDYAYMQKPMVYFQFDREEYRANNYRQGWFHYETHGFGKVTETIHDTLEELEAILQGGGAMSPVYWERQNRLFKFHDHDNCKRNYYSIEEVVKNAGK